MLSLLSLIIIAHADPNSSKGKLQSNTETQEDAETQEVSEAQEILQVRIDNLQNRIVELEESQISSQAKSNLQEQHLMDLSILIDNRISVEERAEAIKRLHQSSHSITLPFYYSILEENPTLTLEIINGLGSFAYEEEISQILTKSLSLDNDIGLRSVAVIGELQQEELIPVLESAITNSEYPKEIREGALTTLQDSYPEYVEKNGIPVVARDESRVGNQFFAISTGITSSVVLGSIGQWGKTDIGETLGYNAGFALGYAGGLGFARQNRPSLGQSLMYTSSMSWGLIQGNFVAQSFEMDDNWEAFSRTMGTLAGFGYGYRSLRKNIEHSNVLELDFVGYWGAQMAVGIRDIFGVSTDEIEYPDFDYETQEEEHIQADKEYYNSQSRIRRYDNQAALIGSTLGLTAGHFIQKEWNVTDETALFGGVYAIELSIAASTAMDAFGIENEQGYVRTAIHTGLAGALLYEHFHPVDFNTSAFTAYGAFAGNLLGAGVPSLLNAKKSHIAHGVTWTGLSGAVVGSAISNRMTFERRDWIFNAVGVPASAWQFFALTEVLEGYNNLDTIQEEGLVATGIGSSVLGLSYLSTKYQIDTSDSLFAGSSMAWGAYYGGLIPLALGIEDKIKTHEHILFSLVSSDIFLATSCIAMKRGYESQKSFFPQITAITGGTLASLGTFLFTDQTQPFGISALGGATLGFVIGSKLQKKGYSFSIAKNRKQKSLPVRLALTPQIQNNGDMGFYVGIYNTGF